MVEDQDEKVVGLASKPKFVLCLKIFEGSGGAVKLVSLVSYSTSTSFMPDASFLFVSFSLLTNSS